MKFDKPAGTNPIDQLKVVGRPTDRIDGKFKTTGTAPYAYERHDVAPNQAYGYILGSAIAKGRIRSMNLADAKASPGVLAIVSTLDHKPLPRGDQNTASLFGGADVQHYHQAIALVVAETFEQARAAANLIRVDYARTQGRFDLEALAPTAPLEGGGSGEGSGAPPIDRVGDFDGAFAAAPVKLDQQYRTPDHTHAMMEPFATIAAWDGPKLTVWTSNQMIAWAKRDLAKTLRLAPENVRVDSP
jgi:xanthine dehydrogenase YagR molybdenum-binding subunit